MNSRVTIALLLQRNVCTSDMALSGLHQPKTASLADIPSGQLLTVEM